MRATRLLLVLSAGCLLACAAHRFLPSLGLHPVVEEALNEPTPEPGDRVEREELVARSAELTKFRDRAAEAGDRTEVARLDAELAEVFIRLSKVNRRLGR